jgi:hypothetical protein
LLPHALSEIHGGARGLIPAATLPLEALISLLSRVEVLLRRLQCCGVMLLLGLWGWDQPGEEPLDVVYKVALEVLVVGFLSVDLDF